jgi:hypothetical protein
MRSLGGVALGLLMLSALPGAHALAAIREVMAVVPGSRSATRSPPPCRQPPGRDPAGDGHGIACGSVVVAPLPGGFRLMGSALI